MSSPSFPLTASSIDSAALITDDEQQSERLLPVVFNHEDDAVRTGELITHFVSAYEQRPAAQSLEQWLIAEFRHYPAVWANEAELITTAREIINTVEHTTAAQLELTAHLERGKSRDSWLAQQLETGATVAGVARVGDYAAQLEQALMTANAQFADVVMTQAGAINQAPTLHGLIAEAEVANQFNLNAQATQSGLRAEVLGSQALDSHDLIVRDADGRIVQNVQMKSYAETESLIQNVRAHHYPPGTTLLVHEHQVERMQREFPELNVSSTLETDGVTAAMPSRKELELLRDRAQQEQELRTYEWNDINRISIAKTIGTQVLLSAALTTALHGGRIIGRRIWNRLMNRENPPASEELREFFTSAIKGGAHVGVQVAVSGAVVVAAKSGWLGAIIKQTPAGRIVNAVCLAMMNAKILYKLAIGELNGPEALDAAGNATCGALGGLITAGYAATQGAAIGAVFGPIGAVIGGVVAGVVGGMAGNKIGEAIYAGSKVLVKSAVNAIKTLASGVATAVTTVARALNPLRWFA